MAIDRGRAHRVPCAVNLPGFNLLLTATLTFIHRHQPALFDIKLFFLNNNPFVEATATQGFSLMLFKGAFSFKWQDVSHSNTEGVVRFQSLPTEDIIFIRRIITISGNRIYRQFVS